jgi:hypothetical protein
MANCLVTRNTAGKITEVKTPEGAPSRLFNEIHSNPFFGDTDSSLRIFSNTYAKSVQELFKDNKNNTYKNGEPKLYYKSSTDKVFSSLDNLLIKGDLGDITMGFKNPNTNDFMPIASFSTDATAKAEFLTSSIQQGILAPKRVLGTDGVTRYKGEGQYDITQLASARAAKFEALVELGAGNTKINELDGTIEFPFTEGYTIAITKEGDKLIKIEDIPNELNGVENQVALLATHGLVTNKLRPLRSGMPAVEKQDDKGLRQSLLNFLANMGFELSTLENYRKNYNTKYGVDPDINAIADMANKVVAIAEGVDLTEELVEEVAHIAIEAYAEQASIVGALALVDLTPEYKQWADTYRAKYAEFAEGVELEDKVRKEILGKVLAKSIKERFSTENKIEEELSLLDKLRAIWNNFTEFLKAGYRPYLADSLTELNTRIADNIFMENMSRFTTDLKSPEFFYSLAGKEAQDISKTLLVTKDIINNVFRTVIKTPTPNQSKLDRIYDDMNEVEILEAINAINGIAHTQLTRINTEVRKAELEGRLISIQDQNTFNALTSSTIPLILQLTNKLTNLKVTPTIVAQKNLILESLKVTALLHSEISPKIQEDLSEYARQLFEEMVAQSDLTPTQKDELWQTTLSGLEDQSFMGQYFSLASQSENLLIGMLRERTARMSAETNRETKAIADGVIANIFNKGLQKFQKTIIKIKDGIKTAYYEGPIDHDAYQKEQKALEIKIISEITGKSIEEVTKHIKDGLSTASILKTDANKNLYRDRVRTESESLKEQMMTPEYYEQRNARYALAGLSPETISLMRDFSSERAQLYNNSNAQVNGKIDRTKLTSSEIAQEQAIKNRQALARSVVDELGEKKEGLETVKFSSLSQTDIDSLPEWKQKFFKAKLIENPEITIVINTMPIDNLAVESRTTFDMINYSLLYQSEKADNPASKGFSAEFMAELDSLEEADRFNFVQANSTIGLSQEYFAEIGEGQSYEAKAEEYISTLANQDEQNDKRGELQHLRNLQLQKTSLLKHYRNQKDPLEINGNNITDTTKAKIRLIEDQIQLIKKSIGMPFEEVSGMESERKLNKSFYLDKIESGKTKYEFAKMHMTASNSHKLTSFESAINMLLDPYNSVKKITAGYEKFVKKQIESNPKLVSQLEIFNSDTSSKIEKSQASVKIKEILFEEFAMANVASYYTRFEPKGYSEMISKFQSGEIDIRDVIDENKKADLLLDENNEVLKYIEIRPDFTWMEELEEQNLVNPKYMKDGLFRQPNLAKYADKEFFKKYGIDMKAWMENPTMDLEKMEPTQNTEEYELLKNLVGLRKTAISKYKDEGLSNPYLRPQVRKNRLEHLIKLNGVQEVKEFFLNREDDKDYGEQVEGEDIDNLGVKIIPKYFQRPVDDVNDLTDNVLTAAFADIKQAILHDKRTEAERDFKALEWQVANQKFKEKGRLGTKIIKTTSGATSSYLKMATEYIDHHLYGIKQSRQMRMNLLGREVDMTKIVTNIQSFVRFSNLAFNPFVDAVSATTGVLNNVADRFAADYYHKSSANKGNTQSLKLMKDLIMESGKVNKESLANHLLEFYDMGDFEGKIASSSFGRTLKWMDQSSYKMSKLANIPVSIRTLLAVLNDYRYVANAEGGGQFLNWEQFHTNRRNADKTRTKQSIESEFTNLSNESMYEHLAVTKNGVTFNDKWKEKALANNVNADEWFNKISTKLSSRVKLIAEYADGTLNAEDQVAAQRDVLINTVMMHSGWLPIMLSRRFKNRQFNVALDRYEEGHYRTLLNFIPDIIKGRKTGRTMTDVYNALDIGQRKNIKRAGVEFGMWTGMMLLGVMLMAPDDDDSYLESLAKYIYLRTASEFSTQQLQGIPGAVIDKIKNPIVPIRTIEALEPVQLIGDLITLDFDSMGKRIQKQTILKRYSQLTDIEGQISSFQHFNANSLYWLSPENTK